METGEALRGGFTRTILFAVDRQTATFRVGLLPSCWSAPTTELRQTQTNVVAGAATRSGNHSGLVIAA
jgi:hypothetical protein